MNRVIVIVGLFCLTTGLNCFAQAEQELPSVSDNPPVHPAPGRARDLTVLAPTLPKEELNRVVLNRLLQDIIQQPDLTQRQLRFNATELLDIQIILSNAQSFVNDNDMAAIRVMCGTWNNSSLSGELRIRQAMDAYHWREQFTRNFIESYYHMVIADIEAVLSAPSLSTFRDYLNDRRRRLANVGITTMDSIVANVRSSAESIEFHCRERR